MFNFKVDSKKYSTLLLGILSLSDDGDQRDQVSAMSEIIASGTIVDVAI